MSNKSYETPFPGCKAIILKDNKYTLLACQVCNGNTRDPDKEFINGIRGFVQHLANEHPNVKFDANSSCHVVLSDEQVEQIRAGEYVAAGVKMVMCAKSGSGHAMEHKIRKFPIWHYTHIVELENGKHAELVCKLCGGNAIPLKGSARKKEEELVFLKGVTGLVSHLSLAHRASKPVDGKWETYVFDQCMEILSDEKFGKLLKDFGCEDIKKQRVERSRIAAHKGGGRKKQAVTKSGDAVEQVGQKDEGESDGGETDSGSLSEIEREFYAVPVNVRFSFGDLAASLREKLDAERRLRQR